MSFHSTRRIPRCCRPWDSYEIYSLYSRDSGVEPERLGISEIKSRRKLLNSAPVFSVIHSTFGHNNYLLCVNDGDNLNYVSMEAWLDCRERDDQCTIDQYGYHIISTTAVTLLVGYVELSIISFQSSLRICSSIQDKHLWNRPPCLKTHLLLWASLAM